MQSLLCSTVTRSLSSMQGFVYCQQALAWVSVHTAILTIWGTENLAGLIKHQVPCSAIYWSLLAWSELHSRWYLFVQEWCELLHLLIASWQGLSFLCQRPALLQEGLLPLYMPSLLPARSHACHQVRPVIPNSSGVCRYLAFHGLSMALEKVSRKAEK